MGRKGFYLTSDFLRQPGEWDPGLERTVSCAAQFPSSESLTMWKSLQSTWSVQDWAPRGGNLESRPPIPLLPPLIRTSWGCYWPAGPFQNPVRGGGPVARTLGLTFEWHQASQVAVVVKNLPASAGDIRDAGSILGSGRSPGGGNGHSLQYSCLGNPMDRGAWWATVHGVTNNWTQLKRLSMCTQGFCGTNEKRERKCHLQRDPALWWAVRLTQNTLPPLSPWTWATTSCSRSKTQANGDETICLKWLPSRKCWSWAPTLCWFQVSCALHGGCGWVCLRMKPSRVQPPPAELKARTLTPKHDLGLCDWEKSKWWTGTSVDSSKQPVTQIGWCLRMLSS